MKKVLLAGMLLLTVVATARAQRAKSYDEGFFYGITAGINIANMAKQEGGDLLVRTNAGGVAGYRFGYRLALEGELLYSGSGTSFYSRKIGDYDFNDIVHVNFTYLNIPVTARFYIVGGLNIHAGAQVGFLVRQRLNYRGDKYDIKGLLNTNSFDFAVPVGIGYDFGRLALDARYQKGTIDVIKDDLEHTYNTLFCFNFSYRF